MDKDRCEAIIIHEDKIKEVQKHLLDQHKLEGVSMIFKLLSDPTRIKILYALEKQELCVCDLSIVLDMTQSAVSHQLKLLRMNQLVRHRKEGKTVFYSLDDEHVHLIFNQALAHVSEVKHR